MGARELAERYWEEVTHVSLGLVGARPLADGSELRVRPLGVRLLRFGPVELTSGPQRVSCRFPILGGVLARRPAGALVISQSVAEDRAQLRAALTGFAPRLGSRLYDHVQRRVHVAISRRFFRRLLEERP